MLVDIAFLKFTIIKVADKVAYKVDYKVVYKVDYKF